ncbi:MAG: 3-deoxy-7-phosphoheptulonate synthase, partial [Paenibacillus sp.]|nr:3-deoxy-7-phosphoheptulonate synthase [Paenibacillus sp.]
MSNQELDALRGQLDELNRELLELICKRGSITQEIAIVKQTQGIPKYDPVREKQMLDVLTAANTGPFDEATIRHLFKQIFKASLDLQQKDHKKHLLVSRKRQTDDTVVRSKNVAIGGGAHIMVAGPCSIESYEQVRTVAAALKASG